jgi:hypothetical protein
MKRYEPSTPRVGIAAVAVCMTLATAAVMVIAPAALQSDADRAKIIARVRPVGTSVTIHPSRIDVVAVREHTDMWNQASNRAAVHANLRQQ